MANLEKYNEIFTRLFDIDESALNEEFTFAAVDKWDSLLHLTLIDELENGFDFMFETDDILHFGGYCNGKAILEKYGIDFGA